MEPSRKAWQPGLTTAPGQQQRAQQDEPEHALRIAPKAEVKASLYGQKPGDRAAGVSTGVPPEGMESLATRNLRIDRIPIRSKRLYVAMWEPPAPQGEAEGMGRGIREGDAQRKWHRTPGDRFKRANGVHDVLGPALKGIDLRIRFPGCAE